MEAVVEKASCSLSSHVARAESLQCGSHSQDLATITTLPDTHERVESPELARDRLVQTIEPIYSCILKQCPSHGFECTPGEDAKFVHVSRLALRQLWLAATDQVPQQAFPPRLCEPFRWEPLRGHGSDDCRLRRVERTRAAKRRRVAGRCAGEEVVEEKKADASRHDTCRPAPHEPEHASRENPFNPGDIYDDNHFETFLFGFLSSQTLSCTLQRASLGARRKRLARALGRRPDAARAPPSDALAPRDAR